MWQYKTMPNDKNDKELQEGAVLDLFIKTYSSLRWDVKRVHYEIVGRDGDGRQRHDYTVRLDCYNRELMIEITTLGDGTDSYVAQALRNEAQRLAHDYHEGYFIFLPRKTRPKQLKHLFAEAQNHASIIAPGDNDKDDLNKLITRLRKANKPYIRRNGAGVTQIHTNGEGACSLKEGLQSAITKKEAKDYSPFQQEEMVLVIDDQSIYQGRWYMGKMSTLMNYCFLGSRFREIFILSRKNSPSVENNTPQEVSLIPIKANWCSPVLSNIVRVADLLNKGWTPPQNW